MHDNCVISDMQYSFQASAVTCALIVHLSVIDYYVISV